MPVNIGSVISLGMVAQGFRAERDRNICSPLLAARSVQGFRVCAFI
jgi:hypothetical protein